MSKKRIIRLCFNQFSCPVVGEESLLSTEFFPWVGYESSFTVEDLIFTV